MAAEGVEVLSHGGGEEEGRLHDDGDPAPQVVQSAERRVGAVDQHAPAPLQPIITSASASTRTRTRTRTRTSSTPFLAAAPATVP